MFTQALARRVQRRPLLQLLLGPHGVDRYTEIVDPMWTSDTRATVLRVHRSTPRSVTLWLTANHPLSWRAGQHLNVTVEVDGRRRTRCYSPANAPGSDLIELTVTRHDGGLVSGHLHRSARPGLVVGLSGPAGDFVLPDVRPRRPLFVAGGSGITPVLGMLRTLAAEGWDGRATLLYYLRDLGDAAYRDELSRLPGLTVRYGCTRSAGGDLDGRFGPDHLVAAPGAAPDDPDAVFVCGPAALVEAVRGWRPDALAEHFTPPAFAAAPGDPSGSRITFRDSGIGVIDDGRPLLDQAEAAGLAPQSGCRMGICHTCTRRKVSGAVRDLTTGAISAAADEDVQICVSAAVGDVEIEL